MSALQYPKPPRLPLLLIALFCLGQVSAFSPPSPALIVPRHSPIGSLRSSDLTTPEPIANSEKEYSFFDEASVYVRAGSGGQGASTYKKAKKSQNGIPDGGSGGMGGSVYFEVDDSGSLNTLAKFHGSRTAVNDNNQNPQANKSKQQRLVSFRAETGKPGGRMYDNGRRGEDCIVKVPPGTVVCIERVSEEEEAGDEEFGEDDEDEEAEGLIELGTLTIDNPKLLVAQGGMGGQGTATLKGKSKGATRKGPEGGERHRLRLTLKMVADVALVGKPNAGKSTFLAAVTRAKPKIANYPFTTVVPNLGVWIPAELQQQQQHHQDSSGEKAAGSAGVVLCDVPGLIAGAAEGVGLGHAFLRHVERCRVMLHLVDGTSEDPVGDYQMVQEEIRRYGTGSLADKPQVVVVNKIDAWEQEGSDVFNERKQDLLDKLKEATGHTRIMWVSAKERQNMDELMKRMATYVTKIKDSDKAQAA